MNIIPEHTETQCDRILAELRRAQGDWVAMPHLAAVSGAYAVHSRISDLRKLGLDIEVKIEGARPKQSFYRLLTTVQTAMDFSPVEKPN